MTEFLFLLKPVKILVFVTLLHALLGCEPGKKANRYLVVILIICFATEMVMPLLDYFGYETGLAMTISIIVHNVLWIWLLRIFVGLQTAAQLSIIAYLTFALVNVLFLEGSHKFNYSTFVVGALIYIGLFVYGSFYRLKTEEFVLFLSNSYLLLAAPVLFFFGLSLMFGFRSREITSALLFDRIKLYDLIIYFVNIVYYLLINIYIYREKRVTNGI
ncbi:MAG TPA: hypothetical protein VF581_04525 [Flavobacterium sp.]|jgi:hypothetical protein